MTKDKLKVACVSMNSQANKEENIAQARQAIEKASQKGAEWIVLPELFSYMGPYADLSRNAEPSSGPLNTELSQLAQKHKVTLFAPVPELPTSGHSMSTQGYRKVYNTLYVFGPSGSLLQTYRKVHLFHVQYGDTARSESDGFLAGNKILSFAHEGWKVACAICYDIRFPEFLVSLYRERPFDILVLPSAFTEATGQAHWELLLRARAVEYQSYVLGANQTGMHYDDKKSFGHSMIIDPWGDKLAETGADAGIAIAELSRERIRSIRERIPILTNRQPDIYL